MYLCSICVCGGNSYTLVNNSVTFEIIHFDTIMESLDGVLQKQGIRKRLKLI